MHHGTSVNHLPFVPSVPSFADPFIITSDWNLRKSFLKHNNTRPKIGFDNNSQRDFRPSAANLLNGQPLFFSLIKT